MIKLKTRTVRVDEIVVDPRAQTRADGVDPEHVAQMVESIDDLPPMVCVEVEGKLYLADGFHRMDAYRKAKRIRVGILAAKGTEDDWIDAFASANDNQKGKPRRREDKRNAVVRALEMRPTWTNRRIAEAAKVSEFMVRQVRKYEPETSHDDGNQLREIATETPATREGKDGKKYKKNKSKSADDKPLEQPVAAIDAEPVSQETEPPAVDPEQVDTDSEQSVDPAEEFCGVLKGLCRELDFIGQRVAALKDSPYSRFVHWQSAQVQIKNGRETLWQGQPTHDCPYCKTAGEVQPNCRCCGGLNVTTKSAYKAGSAAMGDRPQ